MSEIFLIIKCKSVTKYGQKKIFTKISQQSEDKTFKSINYISLDIIDDKGIKLNTMEKVWKKNSKKYQ